MKTHSFAHFLCAPVGDSNHQVSNNPDLGLGLM